MYEEAPCSIAGIDVDDGAPEVRSPPDLASDETTISADAALDVTQEFNTVALEGNPKKDLEFIKDLAETGELRPVIDKCYVLDEIAEAHRHVETGHKKGSVVVSLG